ncbi:MAG: hypothetical protein ACD_76C00037G0001 [uncultured bacterium]|nr:MAG: hypothetical protein ACD_76C00037G0001 [uncultured bacterium]HBD05766.1 hypothetical protein [Candidatus Uhrbacteria bacterium]
MVSALLSVLLPTFGLVFLGFLARRIKVWNGSAAEVLNRYAYYFALPALIFESVKNIDPARITGQAEVRLIFGVVAVHLFVFATLAAISGFRFISKETKAMLPIVAAVGSTAYLGIPFVTYAFGDEYTAIASILSASLIVPLIFISVFWLNHHGHAREKSASWHRLLELPILWAVLAGLIWPIFNLSDLPIYANRFLAILSGSAGPTALLALGAFEYDIKLRDLPWLRGVILAGIKTFGMTVLVFFVLRTLGVSGAYLFVGSAMSATSVAITASVLAGEYQVGQKLVVSTIMLSTFFSLIALGAISVLYVI